MSKAAALCDVASLERMRWRCRRGLLELDIVLGRFIEHYSGLDSKQQLIFESLLDLPDTQLWDMISGKEPVLDEKQREMLSLINAA